MKTLLKYDFRIQQTVILIFIITLLMLAITKNESLITLAQIEFFLLAILQYTLNIAKFYNKNYVRTHSRIIYTFISTYVIITFLLFILCLSLKYPILNNFLEWMPVSWLIASPVLIILSLSISFSDRKKKQLKNN
ncbi:hypothetical protein SAMN05421846_110117 [Chryseobacterium taeanense]|uniref:Uncharacterized protein n=1 Tax=Chryseobacterium taeanense TaxID=311334 RepID=A0A1G8LZU9_9FLAO|nr:hypothetical protein SAMN05421846_110117 [Chryseobacterium taeanense]